MGLFRKVLVATDFSDASGGALALARSVARTEGAALTVVHVMELPALPEGLQVDLVTPLTEAADARFVPLMAAVRADVPGAAQRLELGAPWERILEVSREIGADLVVVGTHGRRGVVHALLGSVAERVVRLSPVPVLTVRAPEPA
jgi:nucleotide-binding universal stress UspA family protein